MLVYLVGAYAYAQPGPSGVGGTTTKYFIAMNLNVIRRSSQEMAETNTSNGSIE